MIHEIKTWPAPFAAIKSGAKRHEIRKNDRGYNVGDWLHQREWDPDKGYSGEELLCRVTYVSPGGTWGLPPDICVMSIVIDATMVVVKHDG